MKAEKVVISNNLHVLYDFRDYPWAMPVFHYHDQYEIYILEQGERTLIINNKVFKTAKNDVALFNPNAFHRSYGDTPFSGICIHFSESIIDYHFTEESKKILLKCFSKNIITIDDSALDQIRCLAKKISSVSERKFIYFSMILEILIMYSNYNDENNKIIVQENLFPTVEFINENFKNIKTLDDISDKLFMSKAYLCRLFKKQTGVTISYYLNSVRIQHSCTLLSDAIKSISDIANECGYGSLSYFSRTFKKFMGCTPFDFRSKYNK